nr:MAG TPA_asm: BNR/Asp-box repeat protein [Caudoviricetes sp.]
MKTIEKVEIKKLSFPVGNVYNYNAMIFRSVDGGKTFIYCGYGKYFTMLEEAEAYKAEIELK